MIKSSIVFFGWPDINPDQILEDILVHIFHLSYKIDNKLYKKYNSKWSRAHTDKVWHVKFYDYWRTTLTISRDYVHSELP